MSEARERLARHFVHVPLIFRRHISRFEVVGMACSQVQ